MSLSPFEIIVVLFVVALFFGAGRIPTVMEHLGKGISSFKKGLRDDTL